jgi:hypothetical protein
MDTARAVENGKNFPYDRFGFCFVQLKEVEGV